MTLRPAFVSYILKPLGFLAQLAYATVRETYVTQRLSAHGETIEGTVAVVSQPYARRRGYYVIVTVRYAAADNSVHMTTMTQNVHSSTDPRALAPGTPVIVTYDPAHPSFARVQGDSTNDADEPLISGILQGMFALLALGLLAPKSWKSWHAPVFPAKRD